MTNSTRDTLQRSDKPIKGRFLDAQIRALTSNDEIANVYDHQTPPDYPIAYKAGWWFFCGLPFFVNKHVLVPRMDTQDLVHEAAKKAKQQALNILDLCTGSGCIAIALAKQTKANIYASDISKKALGVAKKNAKFNEAKINFYQSDLFEKVPEQFDIIVCNPPYIKTNEIGKHDKSILHEPQNALDGGADGLNFYRQIIADASDHLVPNGWLFFEIGDKVQAEEVKSLLQGASFNDITIKGERVIYARQIARD